MNEATWFGVDVDPDGARVAVLLDVLTLPATGPAPDDTTVALFLRGVSR